TAYVGKAASTGRPRGSIRPHRGAFQGPVTAGVGPTQSARHAQSAGAFRSSSVNAGIGAAGSLIRASRIALTLAEAVVVDGTMTSRSDPTWTTPPEPPLLRGGRVARGRSAADRNSGRRTD